MEPFLRFLTLPVPFQHLHKSTPVSIILSQGGKMASPLNGGGGSLAKNTTFTPQTPNSLRCARAPATAPGMCTKVKPFRLNTVADLPHVRCDDQSHGNCERPGRAGKHSSLPFRVNGSGQAHQFAPLAPCDLLPSAVFPLQARFFPPKVWYIRFFQKKWQKKFLCAFGASS